jgi:TIR domain
MNRKSDTSSHIPASGVFEFDVFLSHNSADKPAVEILARRLQAAGVKVWLDKWSLIPGEPWQEALEEGLDRSRTVAIAIGPAGIGPWQNEEMRSALDIRVRDRGYRVIPLLLPGADLRRHPIPLFLSRLTWVDFRAGLAEADAFAGLLSGIRGQPLGVGPGGGPTPPQGALPSSGSAPTFSASLNGSGAIAQGPGAVAAGTGGVAVGGDVKGSIIITGHGNVVDSQVEGSEDEEKDKDE